MDLKDNEVFQNMFLLCFFIGIILYFVLWYIFKKKGISLSSLKTKSVFLIIGILPVLILLWALPDLPLTIKAAITLLGVATEFAYFYVLGKASKSFRNKFGKNT